MVGKDKTIQACKHSYIPRKNCFVSHSVCKLRNSCPNRAGSQQIYHLMQRTKSTSAPYICFFFRYQSDGDVRRMIRKFRSVRCSGTVGIAANIVIYGKSEEEHHNHMHEQMNRCTSTGAKASRQMQD